MSEVDQRVSPYTLSNEELKLAEDPDLFAGMTPDQVTEEMYRRPWAYDPDDDPRYEESPIEPNDIDGVLGR